MVNTRTEEGIKIVVEKTGILLQGKEGRETGSGQSSIRLDTDIILLDTNLLTYFLCKTSTSHETSKCRSTPNGSYNRFFL